MTTASTATMVEVLPDLDDMIYGPNPVAPTREQIEGVIDAINDLAQGLKSTLAPSGPTPIILKSGLAQLPNRDNGGWDVVFQVVALHKRAIKLANEHSKWVDRLSDFE